MTPAPRPPPSPWPGIAVTTLIALVVAALVFYGRGGC